MHRERIVAVAQHAHHAGGEVHFETNVCAIRGGRFRRDTLRRRKTAVGHAGGAVGVGGCRIATGAEADAKAEHRDVGANEEAGELRHSGVRLGNAAVYGKSRARAIHGEPKHAAREFVRGIQSTRWRILEQIHVVHLGQTAVKSVLEYQRTTYVVPKPRPTRCAATRRRHTRHRRSGGSRAPTRDRGRADFSTRAVRPVGSTDAALAAAGRCV